MTKFPPSGISSEQILAAIDQGKSQDIDWQSGKALSLVYHLDEEHDTLLQEASTRYFSENYINPLAFRSLKMMEQDLVQMSADMLHGGKETVGCVSSGGTESILLAVLAARERASHVKKPEMVVPASIHVAFDKAGHLFGVKVIRVPINKDYRADVDKMARHINPRTILLAASAPQFPQGVIDPIAQIAALAEQNKLPFHVDSCIGGFMLPWLERLGQPIPEFDFRIPGVSSISADIHKYGYGAKGTSVLLYRDMSYMKHQLFVATDWSGGMYVSPTLAGSRSGGPIAAAWAAFHSLGIEGYLRTAKVTLASFQKLRKGIQALTGLKIVGEPEMTILSYTTDEPGLSIFAIADLLEEKGWLVDRQQHPNSIHLTVMYRHAEIIDAYLRDLKEALKKTRAHPELAAEGNAAMYGLMAKIPLRGLVKSKVHRIVEGMYSPEGALPDLSDTTDVKGGDPTDQIARKGLMYHQKLSRRWHLFKERIYRMFS